MPVDKPPILVIIADSIIFSVADTEEQKLLSRSFLLSDIKISSLFFQIRVHILV